MEEMKALLETWIANVDDPELSAELVAMRDNDSACRDAFFQDLEFGTAGLRGTLGAGPNRMNIHTVGRATQGLADYLNANFTNPTVAVCRDSRNKGELFVQVVAGVLAANGIKSFLYPRIEPTPALSFAVRDLGCQAGINMTASHNPAEYNGYKVYGADGCQITSQAAKDIQAAILGTDTFAGVKCMPFDQAISEGWAQWIAEDTLDRYLDAVAGQSLDAAPDAPVKVVYTPLNGAGLECVTRILDRIGVTDVTVVPQQKDPDGNFPTCPYPNPEIRQALACGLELCETVRPDLLLATDPDSDRVGIAAAHNGEYQLITGNEMGIMLLDYICKARAQRGEDLGRAVAVTTIVSTAMVDKLAANYGFQMRRCLTGFKYIGEQIAILEAVDQADRFVFGFEESYGYLSGTYARDKDAVVASMLICQMARYYKQQGKDLVEALNELYQQYGFHKNATISLSYPGADGAQQMKDIMARLRAQAPTEVAGMKVERVVDYAQAAPMPVAGTDGAAYGDQPQTLPTANVFELQLEGGNKLIIRPSGTEPKIKAYMFADCPTPEESDAVVERLDAAARALLA